MSILAKLMPLEDRLRAVLRRRAQLRQLGAQDRATVALTLRRAAHELDRLNKIDGTYTPGDYMEYMGGRVPLAPQLRDAADRLEVAS
jgi:hypothetical protein